MSKTLRRNGSRAEAYIRRTDSAGGGGIDREAILHRRRKNAMISLLGEFEAVIERLLPPGHEREIENFKMSCRAKLNGLTFEAIELMKLQPGEHLNEHAVDLAERHAFDANGGHDKS